MFGRGEKHTRDNRAGLPRPVERVEVSESHVWLRWILFLLAALIGVTGIVYGIQSLVSGESGWREISVKEGDDSFAGAGFLFRYPLLGEKETPAAEYKRVSLCYTEAAILSQRLFDETNCYDGVLNLALVNQHPGQPIEVDPILYRALALICRRMQSEGERWLYQGFLYDAYRPVFGSTTDEEARLADPMTNPDAIRDRETLAAFAGDESAVSLTLLGNNTVSLHVSDAYRTYAEENGLSAYLDFHYLKNAFRIDVMADILTEAGFTGGILSSYDGYTRVLKADDTVYDTVLTALRGNTVYEAARIAYRGVCSLVSLHTMPLCEEDTLRTYVYADGTIRHGYLGKDGTCLASVPHLIARSEEEGCAELLLSLLPCFLRETLSVKAMPLEKASCAYYDPKAETIVYTDPAFLPIPLSDFPVLRQEMKP